MCSTGGSGISGKTGYFTAPSKPMRNWRPTWRVRAITSTGATCWCWNPKPTCRSAAKAPPDDGDALALTFAPPVAPTEVEEEDEEEQFGRYTGSSSSGEWMR